MSRRLTRIGNRCGVSLYRALDGRLASGRRDVHVQLRAKYARKAGRTIPVAVLERL